MNRRGSFSEVVRVDVVVDARMAARAAVTAPVGEDLEDEGLCLILP